MRPLFYSLSPEAQVSIQTDYKRRRKSKALAYFAWFFLGWHYLYLRRIPLQFAFWLTFGGLLVWWLIDLFRVGPLVNRMNEDSARELMVQYNAMPAQERRAQSAEPQIHYHLMPQPGAAPAVIVHGTPGMQLGGAAAASPPASAHGPESWPVAEESQQEQQRAVGPKYALAACAAVGMLMGVYALVPWESSWAADPQVVTFVAARDANVREGPATRHRAAWRNRGRGGVAGHCRARAQPGCALAPPVRRCARGRIRLPVELGAAGGLALVRPDMSAASLCVDAVTSDPSSSAPGARPIARRWTLNVLRAAPIPVLQVPSFYQIGRGHQLFSIQIGLRLLHTGG